MSHLQTVREPAIAFSGYYPDEALFPDFILDQFPGSTLRSAQGKPMSLPEGATHFGFVASGTVFLVWEDGSFNLSEGFYFSVPGAVALNLSRDAYCMTISREGYNGFFHVGKTEHQGRLRYIDGCTDSLLVPPVRMGDACLNLLYFPPGIDQTMHTHPSERIGMVLSGRGVCVTPSEEIPLTPGMMFCIHREGRHKFRTVDQDMRVLAYHPDSDFGPTDQDHPMINRTIVDGVSAKHLESIHTR